MNKKCPSYTENKVIIHTHTNQREHLKLLSRVYFAKTVSMLRCENTDSAHSFDLFLGPSAEELGLDDDGLFGEFSFTQHLKVTLKHTHTHTFYCRLNKAGDLYMNHL